MNLEITNIKFFKLCRIVVNNHNLTHFSAAALCCHKMKFFRNSISNAPYSASNFVEWFIVKDLDIKNVKYCTSQLKFFFFFNKTKNMIFLEVTVTIIGENTSIKCSQCIEKMWFYTYFLKNRSFCQSYSQIFTLMQL